MSELNTEIEDLASKHFIKVARAYLPEMKQLFRGGGLTVESGWDNVSAHGIVQCLVAYDLGIKLSLPIEDLNKLMQVAIVHDWEKRIQIKKDLSEAEIKRANKSFSDLGVDTVLLAATGIEFIKKYRRGESTSFVERLQFYIDDIVQDRTIVSLDTRLDEVSKRKQYLNEDERLTKELGGIVYWDAEKRIAHEIEREIFEKLRLHGSIIDNPEDIPNFIRKSVQAIYY